MRKCNCSRSVYGDAARVLIGIDEDVEGGSSIVEGDVVADAIDISRLQGGVVTPVRGESGVPQAAGNVSFPYDGGGIGDVIADDVHGDHVGRGQIIFLAGRSRGIELVVDAGVPVLRIAGAGVVAVEVRIAIVDGEISEGAGGESAGARRGEAEEVVGDVGGKIAEAGGC